MTQISAKQESNRSWWQSNPMTYDWERTLQSQQGSQEWYEEIDRRFLDSAYYAKEKQGKPFGRFLVQSEIEGKDVLEIGCGMGTHAAMLAKAGAHLTAIDLTPRAVEMTSRRFELFGLPGKIQLADAERLPFADRSFDLVWSWGVIHHSASMENCLSEIRRVLRPGGNLFFMVYYRPSIVYYIYNGLIRGILMGQLVRKSLQQIYTESSDGFFARVLDKREMRALLGDHYENLRMNIVGLKAELFPIPGCRMKRGLEKITPDWFASAILSKWGSMLVVQASKRKG